jgi:Xaa-Pro dipeptidase
VAAGQVFTIEPGVYFIPPLLAKLRAAPTAKHVDWTLVDALTPLGGIRIEDDLAVVGPAGPSGPVARNLTREHLPIGGGTATSTTAGSLRPAELRA